MAKPRILVIGNSKFDLILRTRSMPEIGEKVVSDYAYSFVPSGNGLLSAISLSECGSDSIFCTRVGDDTFGDKLKSLFASKKVDPRFVITDKKRSTGLDTNITDSTGITRILSYPSANTALNDENIEEAFMSYPDAVLIGSEIPNSILYQAIKTANDKKIPVIYDPCGLEYSSFDKDAMGDIEVFTPNADEIYQLTKIKPDDVESCVHSCIKLINMLKCHYIVIKLASKGCFVFDGVYSEIIPSFDTTIVDHSGTGAIFNAGLAHMYVLSSDIINASVFANMCASISLSKTGAFNSIPTSDEIESFILSKKLNFD